MIPSITYPRPCTPTNEHLLNPLQTISQHHKQQAPTPSQHFPKHAQQSLHHSEALCQQLHPLIHSHLHFLQHSLHLPFSLFFCYLLPTRIGLSVFGIYGCTAFSSISVVQQQNTFMQIYRVSDNIFRHQSFVSEHWQFQFLKHPQQFYVFYLLPVALFLLVVLD